MAHKRVRMRMRESQVSGVFVLADRQDLCQRPTDSHHRRRHHDHHENTPYKRLPRLLEQDKSYGDAVQRTQDTKLSTLG